MTGRIEIVCLGTDDQIHLDINIVGEITSVEVMGLLEMAKIQYLRAKTESLTGEEA